jgi:hypothetical protein
LGILAAALVLIAADGITGRGPAGSFLPLPMLAAVALGCWILVMLAQRQGMRVLLRKSTLRPGRVPAGRRRRRPLVKGPHGESFTRWSGWR